MSNKELAVAFLQTLAANKVQDAYRQYVSPDFIDHNQYFAGVKLWDLAQEIISDSPNRNGLF